MTNEYTDDEYTKKGRRELGTITSVNIGPHEHYGILTSMIGITFGTGGTHQGFGGWVLNADIAEDFVRSVTRTFGKESSKPDAIMGEKVYALRNFGTWNDNIVGLESVATGRRFVMHDWIVKHFPETKTPADQERERLESRIECAKRDAARAQAELATLDKRFRQWRST